MRTSCGKSVCSAPEYDRVRQQDETDFAMNPVQHRGKPKHSWSATFFSVTLVIFYVLEILFVAVLVGSLWIAGNPGSGELLSMIFNARTLERTDRGSN